MKKIVGIISVFVLALFGAITAFAANELTVNTTSGTTMNYAGTMDGANVFAVLVQVVDNGGNVVVVDSATVTDNQFSGTINGLTAGTSYTLRAANYDGGPWIEKTFSMPDDTPEPTGTPTPTGTPVPTPAPTTPVTQPSAEPEKTEKPKTTTPPSSAPATTPVKSTTTEKQDSSDKEPAVENLSVDTVVDGDVPDTTMNTSKTELLEAPGILTKEERAKVEKGEEAKIWLQVKEATNVPKEDQVKIEDKIKEVIGNDIQPFYIDLTLWKKVGNGSALNISAPGTKISVTITIPENIRNADTAKTRRYCIIRLHEGVVEVLEGELDKNWNFTFETDCFSTYAIAYEDVDVTDSEKVETGTEAKSGTAPGTNSDTAPEEGGTNPILLICLIVALGIIIISAIVLFRKKSGEKDEY